MYTDRPESVRVSVCLVIRACLDHVMFMCNFMFYIFGEADDFSARKDKIATFREIESNMDAKLVSVLE